MARTVLPLARNKRSSLRRLVDRYDETLLLQTHPFRSPLAVRLTDAIGCVSSAIESQAPSAIATFDHFGGKSFFEAYPVALDAPAFMAASFGGLQSELQSAKPGELVRFLALYSKDRVLGKAAFEALGEMYVAAVLRDPGSSRAPGLGAIIDAFRSARKHGFAPTKVPGARIGVIEVTGNPPLQHGRIEFPAEIELDLPAEATKASLDEALFNPIAKLADYLVVFDVMSAEVRRRVTAVRKIPSKVLIGYRDVPNPAYPAAHLRVIETRAELATAEAQSAARGSHIDYSPIAAFVDLVGGIVARSNYEEALAELANTPQSVKEAIYERYELEKAAIFSSRTMTVSYYVIDRNEQHYLKSTFGATASKTFSVNYNLRDDDPDKLRHLAAAQTERDVARCEESAVSVSLSRLVDDYRANIGDAAALPLFVDLREEMLLDRRPAIAKLPEEFL